MKKYSPKVRGFTLIELLVVVAIIGILTGIVVASLTPAKSKARDAKRISDLGNIQLAISLYFDRCKQYPPTPLNLDSGTGTGDCTASGSVKLGDYISTIPTQPGGTAYTYAVSGSPSNDYILRVQLENDNEILKDDVDPAFGSVVCTDNADPYYYCLGSK
ncbi:MAG: hypothetical protein A3C79_02570 [Candidatus Taylorbacteria bacterium RIFCSPHIGHO2_02_FULL_45_28]|uniref:Type II secretion system protein GspG C-terminal domain-containing protein n=1 Tax=Candidatus Taylorbacteria bacterium RIFCSPHIGHO2_12_FULL_45_16 TaxID=1802315 RepID=A0A1G2MXV6_9BACT|nr:MAG: hypothetical protein A2830_03375 [Candidatus Taylorbacteria bacterium RIFCSPHIGHO2_01_FULL_44_110]OHA25333.1 MAG: hypothetical protein A3C79_02570 [Candidatus Taylorbacteria bacterium RIFCSPHIGHO2_02_FULL_45_28]OHA28720.1 MAG: hypothetical protein A3F51_03035 [Candidatus Taylorbacteria bacterium RIFCSPHIGHO2_12_FULL_45_16]OHA32994.1 MAG: hypothetical protein A3A23_01215 [Candidatus Taylorbacteria bacterium RIFCSPLOWO2_01_FULL_45_59]OHA38482.1 MAG: hypothetical protein A3I98_00725 [Candi